MRFQAVAAQHGAMNFGRAQLPLARRGVGHFAAVGCTLPAALLPREQLSEGVLGLGLAILVERVLLGVVHVGGGHGGQHGGHDETNATKSVDHI